MTTWHLALKSLALGTSHFNDNLTSDTEVHSSSTSHFNDNLTSGTEVLSAGYFSPQRQPDIWHWSTPSWPIFHSHLWRGILSAICMQRVTNWAPLILMRLRVTTAKSGYHLRLSIRPQGTICTPPPLQRNDFREISYLRLLLILYVCRHTNTRLVS